ncbi:hypothetical protein [Kushneria aurantia]|uniref:Uncharacterized protein n=1 Tax=Kushneria aurantia TaxID=504092 RepID=A0ABV6FZ76_9GAMM
MRLPDAELAARARGDLLAAGSLIHRPPHPALSHVLRISAVEDALALGRLATLEDVLANG